MPTGKPTKMKQCKICGDLFLPEKPSSTLCPKTHYSSCPICGKQIVWNTTRLVEPCSRACSKELTRRRNLEKYGVEHPMQSKQVQANHRKAMLDKYGVESPLQSEEIKNKAIESNREKFGVDWALGSKEIHNEIKKTNLEKYGNESIFKTEYFKEKSKETCIEKYGVDHVSKSKEIQELARQGMINKYGVEHPSQLPEIADKIAKKRSENINVVIENARKTWIEKYGVDNPSKVPSVIDKITATFMRKYGVKRAANVPEFRQKMIDTIIERYDGPYSVMTQQYLENKTNKTISNINLNFQQRLADIGLKTTLEYRIGLKSYDIKIADDNTLIEIDPSYTHNYIGNHWNREGLSENYHLYKSQLAEENGYQCVHVFDWDDPEKIINMLRPKKTIYARKCQIYKLNLDYTNEFLDNYHLQGKCKGQLVCLGLVCEGELYQVMTFGKPRYDKKFEVELLRLCTKPGYQVVGGASKLFKYFTEFYEVGSVISYCDISKFCGKVYEQIGMKLIRTTPPQEIWSRRTDKVTANLLRQRGYDQLFGTNYGKGTSNDELMLKNGWLPVYDCGQRVYAYYK